MLSLQDRAKYIALKREGKTADAKALAKDVYTDMHDTFPEVKIGDRKIEEDSKQLKATRGE